MKVYVYHKPNLSEIELRTSEFFPDGFIGTVDLPIIEPKKTVKKEVNIPTWTRSVVCGFHGDNGYSSEVISGNAKNIKITYEIEE
jgi:hypothetical protein